MPGRSYPGYRPAADPNTSGPRHRNGSRSAADTTNGDSNRATDGELADRNPEDEWIPMLPRITRGDQRLHPDD